MRHAELIDSVRALVADTFHQLRLSDDAVPRQSLLIRDGNYCGRRFDAERGHALWFFEEDQVKVFGAEGRVLRVIDRVSTYTASVKLAA
jgi:hypothetical protein